MITALALIQIEEFALIMMKANNGREAANCDNNK